MGRNTLEGPQIGARWAVKYFQKLIKDAEKEGPEHNAFYFLEDGIQEFVNIVNKVVDKDY